MPEPTDTPSSDPIDVTFLGRDSDVDALKARGAEGRKVLLEGARGVGKTRLLKRLEEHPADFNVVRIDLQGVDSEESLLKRLSEHKVFERDRWGEGKFSGWFGGGPVDAWDAVEEVLKRKTDKQSVVALDEVQKFLDLLHKRDPARAVVHADRLDRAFLNAPHDVGVVLAGSISLRTVTKAIGSNLGADWGVMQLNPIDENSGAALFTEQARYYRDETFSLEGARRAGGLPRWISHLADQVEEDFNLDAAAHRVMQARPFSAEIDHLHRHPNRHLLLQVLKAAAAPNATRQTIETAVLADSEQLDNALEKLQAEYYLHDDLTFVLPLLAEWFRR